MTTSACDFAGVYTLTQADRPALEAVLRALGHAHRSAEDAGFLTDARRTAFGALPGGLIRFLENLARTESFPAVLVKGFGVTDSALGPTPRHWNSQADPRSTMREEAFLVLLGSLLGSVFGWATLQSGHLVHNVLPIRTQEQAQSGHGSLADLAWHTEDGFHPFRCDYLGLMGLRNDDLTPTTVAQIGSVVLDGGRRAVLAQRRFHIRPDDEHLAHLARRPGAEWRGGDDGAVAVLFGDPRSPYLRIDPHFMSARPGDADAAACLAELVGQLESGLRTVALAPGDVLFVDNYRAVHGRTAFSPRYDGRDRWLKKILVTRDLRKSRAQRGGVDQRVIFPGAFDEFEAGARMSFAVTGVKR
ncbi:guanitoxin biosynthesis L-enduracididine beta-hydroxylase GntD [Amycolatopsis magusensis]|uniref:guanitoxin biosynthesis L-enduracididine beta-hydroxylase GntD n=1 Tax=Amycolatopsis magusensis TaxID=882444 RepID=UPI0024A94BB1|nr:guanitoxin biosynthesis L-enduracididine beta-hydroxylase GntD [Amycolatopsis magusensis]MDI5978874.1 guanitoxin biosynthesis L-enduracididine beta-hydroxylase GntD [Amycolatopsis magusensis]